MVVVLLYLRIDLSEKPRNMFTDQDLLMLENKGLSPDDIRNQIAFFESGFPLLKLDRPATSGDGIMCLDKKTVHELSKYYDEESAELRLVKFVPASGAATRMFKDVFLWRDLLMSGIDIKTLIVSKPEAAKFFERLRDFAFWDELVLAMDKDDLDAAYLLENKNYLPLIDYLLFDAGLEYAYLPKALITFHRYGSITRTSLEEHLVEGACFARDKTGQVNLHFTLSPEHIGRFKSKIEQVRENYEKKYMARYQLEYSVQKPSTDTIAVDIENKPIRQSDGTMLFRPGGHGALIENLNELEYDLIFIKNIDNVVPDRLKNDTILYKKALAGMLLRMQKEIFGWMHKLESGILVDEEYRQAVSFAIKGLNLDAELFPRDASLGCSVLKSMFNRPLRVCGMVKNEGEPGGGPFWVRDTGTGKCSLQIVEMSQIDLDNKDQAAIVSNATHFNPVDLVCGTFDYKGEKFDLHDFIDPNTGFISEKSQGGQLIKAFERPGLWNGAMAGWNTAFIEVPLITFNPVKTINDLLREQHQ